MIKQPNELDFSGKKFSMILYGTPGIGKSTLALSAPKPILIDFDRGISRVRASHRKATIECDTYEEVLQDIQSPELANYDTVIIDTGGSFITFLQDWAMRTNPAVNKQKNGALSLKGFGEVKAEFKRFTNLVRDRLNKNIIYVFHSEEQKDKDGNPQQRLLCEGATKNIVWQPCDFGGYVQMIGDQRTITFTPTQEFFAKGCYGVEGTYNIPKLGATDNNDFLTKLFAMAKDNIEEESKTVDPQKQKYEEVMATCRDYISHISNIKELNAVKDAISKMEHALTSKKESGAMLNNKAKEIGAVLDKATKQYVAK